MQSYIEWAQRHPQAAQELRELQGYLTWPQADKSDGKSEAWAQQQDRMTIFKAGGGAWRNNVGATPAVIETNCPKCRFRYEIKQQPTRYGLANDSMQLNAVMKSADLICIIPRYITPQMVGMTIGQFGSVEVKKPGWRFSDNEHNQGQANWGALVSRLGGFHTISQGNIQL